MGQNTFLISLALISIFTLAFLNMAISLGNDVDGKINIGDSDYFTGMNTTVTTNADEGFTTQDASGESFEEASIAEGSDGTLVTGSVFKTAANADKKTVFNVFGNVQRALFGSDPGFNTIFMIIGTLVSFIGLSLIWKTWKGGNPE